MLLLLLGAGTVTPPTPVGPAVCLTLDTRVLALTLAGRPALGLTLDPRPLDLTVRTRALDLSLRTRLLDLTLVERPDCP